MPVDRLDFMLYKERSESNGMGHMGALIHDSMVKLKLHSLA